jgi:hypothetical protein
MYVLQTSGATPLFIASQKGHVECLRTLLSEGAGINQAMVGCHEQAVVRVWTLSARVSN